jgi:hypothetical protein
MKECGRLKDGLQLCKFTLYGIRCLLSLLPKHVLGVGINAICAECHWQLEDSVDLEAVPLPFN